MRDADLHRAGDRAAGMQRPYRALPTRPCSALGPPSLRRDLGWNYSGAPQARAVLPELACAGRPVLLMRPDAGLRVRPCRGRIRTKCNGAPRSPVRRDCDPPGGGAARRASASSDSHQRSGAQEF